MKVKLNSKEYQYLDSAISLGVEFIEELLDQQIGSMKPNTAMMKNHWVRCAYRSNNIIEHNLLKRSDQMRWACLVGDVQSISTNISRASFQLHSDHQSKSGAIAVRNGQPKKVRKKIIVEQMPVSVVLLFSKLDDLDHDLQLLRKATNSNPTLLDSLSKTHKKLLDYKYQLALNKPPYDSAVKRLRTYIGFYKKVQTLAKEII